MVILVSVVLGAELELLRVNSKALGHEIDFNSVDVLDQSGDWWQQLLGDVPIGVDLKGSLLVHVFVGAVREITDGRLAVRLSAGTALADDVRNEIVDQVGVTFALLFHPDCNLHMWQVLGICVLLCLPRELLRDDEV